MARGLRHKRIDLFHLAPWIDEPCNFEFGSGDWIAAKAFSAAVLDELKGDGNYAVFFYVLR